MTTQTADTPLTVALAQALLAAPAGTVTMNEARELAGRRRAGARRRRADHDRELIAAVRAALRPLERDGLAERSVAAFTIRCPAPARLAAWVAARTPACPAVHPEPAAVRSEAPAPGPLTHVPPGEVTRAAQLASVHGPARPPESRWEHTAMSAPAPMRDRLARLLADWPADQLTAAEIEYQLLGKAAGTGDARERLNNLLNEMAAQQIIEFDGWEVSIIGRDILAAQIEANATK